MENFILVQDPSQVEGWLTDSFNEVYTEEPALTGFAMAVLSENYASSDPDKMAFVMMRTFIQNGDLAKTDQKYIVGIRFYSFGDIASIDVISLKKDYHKKIIFEHQERMGWKSYDGEISKSFDYYGESYQAPFAVVGGHLAVKDGNLVEFYGSSGDYGSTIFFSDSNSIASFVAESCGLVVSSDKGYQEKGKAFVQEILEIMLQHKLKPDFYEQLVRETFERRKVDRVFIGQHLGALMTMKVEDRVIKEGGNSLQVMVDELTDGFSRACVLYGVVNKIKNPNKLSEA